MYGHDLFQVFMISDIPQVCLHFHSITNHLQESLCCLKQQSSGGNNVLLYALDLLDNNGFVSPKDTSSTCYSGANITNGSCLFTLRATPRLSLWVHVDQIKRLRQE